MKQFAFSPSGLFRSTLEELSEGKSYFCVNEVIVDEVIGHLYDHKEAGQEFGKDRNSIVEFITDPETMETEEIYWSIDNIFDNGYNLTVQMSC